MSENKKYFYLKLKDSFFSSEEMLVLESVPNGLVYQNIYLRMCLLSLKNDGALTFKNMLPYDLKMLATVLRVDIAQMKMALELFEQLKLVTKTDNEVLFMSDIQTLIGKSSTEAERIARYRKRIADSNNVTPMLPETDCTKSVQMLQSCTPEIEIEKEIKTEQEQNKACVPSFIKEPVDITNFQGFVKSCYFMINAHNQHAKKKIPISKDVFIFSTKEGRELVKIAQEESPEKLLNALENYLKVANSETWKKGFSFSAFCKNYVEYTDEFFDFSKYVDVPEYDDEVCEEFIKKMYRKNLDWFSVYLFNKNKKDWWQNGKPEGEAELKRLFEKWEKSDDEQGGEK